MHRPVERAGPGNHGARAFAGERARVETAFTGQDEVGRLDPPVEVKPRGHQLAARHELRASGAAQPECRAARRTGARHVHECVWLAGERAQHERDPRPGVFQPALILGAHSLLRAKGRRRTPAAEERIVHIAREAERGE
jgi:hypothetical protein